MEVILDTPINLEEIADLCAIGMKRRTLEQRDYQAWHVSNLLQSAQLIAKGDTRYHEYEGEPQGIMSWGRIWESAVDCYLTHYAVQRSGFYQPDVSSSKDDVSGSLDGIMFIPDTGWLVCETKLRFTLNDEIPFSHLQQVRAYCHLADTNLVCYVSGHITSRPPTAQARLRVIRFTKQSIDEAWRGIVSTKDYLISQECFPMKGIA